MLVGGALCRAEPSLACGWRPMRGGTLQRTRSYSPPPPSLPRACHGSSNALPPLPLGSGSCIMFVVTMPWALWASYRSESPADMPSGLCPWDGPPKDSPSIHPSIHPFLCCKCIAHACRHSSHLCAKCRCSALLVFSGWCSQRILRSSPHTLPADWPLPKKQWQGQSVCRC